MITRHGVNTFLYYLCFTLFILLTLLFISFPTRGLAQVSTTITPDASLGTTVSRDGSVHAIAGGTICGANLFHSFDRFDVGTGDTASFTGPNTVDRILSRITGGQPSLIDGTLQSTLQGADLYLLNPSGVMFGPNARLDTRGSFHISTADVLHLADDGLYAVDLSAESVLTLAAPRAFGFLGDQPAAIRVQVE